METTEPTWKEVKEIVKKARSGSAPGPNGIPYKVYKVCPLLLRRLWTLSRVVWRKGNISSCWHVAEGIFTLKEKDAKDITQFRTISLLNVEGKIFFSVLAKRLTKFMTDNNYVCTEGRNIRLIWLCRAYKCTFRTDHRGEDPQWRLDFGLVGFSHCIRLYSPPVN